MVSKIAALPSKLSSLAWEYRLGVSTRGWYGEGGSSDGEHRRYSTIPYRSIFRILDSLSLTPADVFVDLGSGKGRAVFCAATYDIECAIGVEDVELLCELARRNAECMYGRRAPACFLRGRAQDFDFTVGSVFYVFNPFGPETLNAVVQALASGLRRNPRMVRIAYVNPIHDDVLATACFTRYDRWQSRALRWPVSFWRSM